MKTEHERVIEALKEGMDDKVHPTNVPHLLSYAHGYLLKPIDMVLFCPLCGVQHIDAPEKVFPEGGALKNWDNPPHRSHLCHACGCVWRPADVPTNGVREIATKGKDDNFAERKETLRRILR